MGNLVAILFTMWSHATHPPAKHPPPHERAYSDPTEAAAMVELLKHDSQDNDRDDRKRDLEPRKPADGK